MASRQCARASAHRPPAGARSARRDPESRFDWGAAKARSRKLRDGKNIAGPFHVHRTYARPRDAMLLKTVRLAARKRQVEGLCYGRINLANPLMAGFPRPAAMGTC